MRVEAVDTGINQRDVDCTVGHGQQKVFDADVRSRFPLQVCLLLTRFHQRFLITGTGDYHDLFPGQVLHLPRALRTAAIDNDDRCFQVIRAEIEQAFAL
jgi:hypothetical protein